MNTVKVRSGCTLMIAHRGLSGLEMENTCAAFVAAGNHSYFGIETDVHRTGDGNFILLHDDNTARVSGDSVNVEETTFTSLRKLQLHGNAGVKDRADLHLPSLEEYVDICKRYEKVCILELKSKFTEQELRDIVDRIRRANWLDHVVFIAFDYENLHKVRKLLPQQPCQFLTEEIPDGLCDRLAADKMDLDVYFPALTQELVEQFHNKGVKVNCWTVNKKEDAERLIDWGVDFITTNILEGESTCEKV